MVIKVEMFPYSGGRLPLIELPYKVLKEKSEEKKIERKRKEN